MTASISVDWFEIYVSDLPRAIAFYEALFDVQLKHETLGDNSMAVFPYQENRTGGSLTYMPGIPHRPCHGNTIVYLNVPCVTTALDNAVTLGGEIILPRKNIGFCDIGLLRDSEGNTVGVCTAHV